MAVDNFGRLAVLDVYRDIMHKVFFLGLIKDLLPQVTRLLKVHYVKTGEYAYAQRKHFYLHSVTKLRSANA